VNDPDCLLVRPDTRLTLDEVRSLATDIVLTGGSLLLSDDLPALPAERMKIAEVMLPVITEEARVLDWFDAGMPAKLRVDMLTACDSWHILGWFNWSDTPADLIIDSITYDLNDGEYIWREFWSGKTGTFDNTTPLEFRGVAAHGCVLLAVRRLQEGRAQYLGSDLHFSQGLEVAEWREEAQFLEMKLRLPRTAAGELLLKLPFEPATVTINGSPVDASRQADGIYSIPVRVEGFCTVRIDK
jgi:alpha-galactosidase